jgi:hypothetical protein
LAILEAVDLQLVDEGLVKRGVGQAPAAPRAASVRSAARAPRAAKQAAAPPISVMNARPADSP